MGQHLTRFRCGAIPIFLSYLLDGGRGHYGVVAANLAVILPWPCGDLAVMIQRPRQRRNTPLFTVSRDKAESSNGKLYAATGIQGNAPV